MTVVVGVVSQGRVYLAGDSYCGDGETSDPCKDPKVLKLTPKVVFGACGDLRSEANAIRAATSLLSSKPRITSKYLRDKFPQQMYDKAGVATEDSSYLLGHSGRLYYVEYNYSLWEPKLPYAAIGSGRSIALGALAYASACGDLEKDPLLVLERVMDICATHSPWVSPPFTILRL